MGTTAKDSIIIETVFSAPLLKVWEAWTDPAVILNWFGSDPQGTVQEAKLDPRPGGDFKITFRNSDQAEHTCFGVYIEVEEFSKLTFSWKWKSEPGRESYVCILLSSENGCTRQNFEHALVGTSSRHD